MVVVAPHEPDPTHHLSLEDKDGTKVGLVLCDQNGRPNKYGIARSPLQSTALKISQGDTTHADFELPFTPVSQSDWSGGRGQEDLDENVTRFLDSRRLNTMIQGKAFIGPRETYTTGFDESKFLLPGSVKWQPILEGERFYIANCFTTVGAYNAYGDIIVKRKGTPPGDLNGYYYSDVAGEPGIALESGVITVASMPDVLGIHKKVYGLHLNLLAATKYWFVICGPVGSTEKDHWEVAVKDSAGTSMESSDGIAWSNSDVDLYYNAKDFADFELDKIFYEYKSQLYFVVTDKFAGTPRLFMNGYRGAADPNGGALVMLIDATQAWGIDELKGGIVLITQGPGSLEKQPWRKIVSNTATQLMVVDGVEGRSWEIVHTVNTEYVVLGLNTWREIVGHGMAAPITDLMFSEGIVYYAMGDGTNIRRHREYNNAGVWVENDWADDGANKAAFLCRVHDSTNGYEIWGANNDDVEISKATPVVWPNNLAFGAAISVGDDGDKFSGLVQYVDPKTGERILWCLKRGSIFPIKSDKPDELLLDEMGTVAAEENGRAFLVHDRYLYFSMREGLERYYEDQLDDVGPNRDRGLPQYRHGPIVHMVGYPGQFFAAINPEQAKIDPENYPSIMGSKGGKDWHEIYRSASPGAQITRLHIQVVPGEESDRLWFAMGRGRIMWLPITINPLGDNKYRFTHESTLVFSRMYCHMQDVLKLWESLKLMVDNLDKDVCWIEADYKVDDEDAEWKPLEEFFVTSPKMSVKIGGADRVTGMYCIIRLRFQSSDHERTPILRSVVVKTVSKIPIKHGYACTVRLRDNDVDLRSEPDDYTRADDKIAQLDAWANSLAVLKMRSSRTIFDGLEVFIDDTRLTPYISSDELDLQGYIGTIPITEIIEEAT